MDNFNGTDEEVQGEADSCNPLPPFDHDHGPAGRYGRNRSEPLSYTGPGPSRSSTSSSSRSMGGIYSFEAFHTFSRPMSPSSRSSSVDTLSMCEPADVGNDIEGQMGVMDVEYGEIDKREEFRVEDSKVSFWEAFWEVLGYLPRDETVYACQSCHGKPVNPLGRTIPRSMPVPDDSIEFNDGLGRRRRLPVQYFRHWQVFEEMLKCDFAGMPGDTHVQQRQYRMLHGPKARPVSVASWSKIFVPRALINMSMVMVKIRRKNGLCPKPGCDGKTPLNRVSAGYKCANCNLRYFTESQSAAPTPAWTSSLAALTVDDEVTNDPASQPAWLPRVTPWLREQHIAMANANEGGSDERTPDEDRKREMREVGSFKTIHIDEMSKNEKPLQPYKRTSATYPKRRDLVMLVQPKGAKDNAETMTAVATSPETRRISQPPCLAPQTSFNSTEISSDNISTSSKAPQSSKSSTQSSRSTQASSCASPVLPFASARKASQPEFLTLAPVLGIAPAPQPIRNAEVCNVTFEDYAALLRSGKLTSLFYELSSSKTVSTQPLRYDLKMKVIVLSGLIDEVETACTTITTFLNAYRENPANQSERTLFSERRVEEIEQKFNLLDEEANPHEVVTRRGLLPSKAHSLSPNKGRAEAASIPGVLGPEEKEISDEWNNKIVKGFQAQMGVLTPGNYVVGLLMRDSGGVRTPVISVQSQQELSSEQKKQLASHVAELDGVGSTWKSIRFQYFVGPVGRSASSSSETPELTDSISEGYSEYCKPTQEPIFPPQRRRYCMKPDIGTSIGTTRICQHTGTLGAFLCVDGEPRALSVAHLSTKCFMEQMCGFSNPLNVKGHDITQPSQADVQGVDQWIRNLEELLFGAMLDNGTPSSQEEIVKCLDQARKIREEMQDAISKDSLHFGTHLHSSNEGHFRQSQIGGNKFNIAMDWAIYAVNPDRLNHNVIKPLDDGDSCDRDLSDVNPEIPCSGFAPHVPGGLVSAVGRTSGFQIGRINTALYPVCLNGTATLEWGIGNPEDENAHFWETKGPLGQFGDSGALVVNKNDGKACGLIWGSRLADGFPVAIFTPLEMVFDDIRENCGAESIQLLAPSFDLELGPRSVSSGSEDAPVSIFSNKEAAKAESEMTSVFSMPIGYGFETSKGVKTWNDNAWLPLL